MRFVTSAALLGSRHTIDYPQLSITFAINNRYCEVSLKDTSIAAISLLKRVIGTNMPFLQIVRQRGWS